MSRREDPEEKRKAKLLSDAKEKHARYLEFWKPIYDEVEKHRKFTLLGEQLSSERKAQLGVQNPMQPNLLLTYTNHEANKTLQTDYRGKITPNGGGANDIKARERQEVIRGLQRTNNATQVYNDVRRNQVAGGIAYSIKVVDFAAKRGFGKTIMDEFLEDYQNVLPDITTKSPTMEDIRDFFYKREIQICDWEEETGEEPKGWGNEKKRDIWYYWVREDVKDTEYLLADGKTELGSKLGSDLEGVKKDEYGEPLSRPTTDHNWCFYKIDDKFGKLYDETKWRGSYPPLTACTGRRIVAADGKVHYQPLTQFAEEAQEIYTILENIICLRLSMSPYSKWKVALESMNIKVDDLLVKASATGTGTIWYKHLDDAGNLIPPPEEIPPHVLDPILVELQREQRVKIQQIFGIFDANLGEKSNEQSGVAIERRAQGGDLSNFDLQFNYMEYVEQSTRVTLDLIPHYLNAQQQMAFVDEDDNAVLKWINTTGGVQFSPNEEYSLSIEAMPISQTAREDEARSLMEMAKAMPIIAQNPQAVALIVKAQPGRYAGQIAEFIAQGDPQIAEAKKIIGELEAQLQQVTQEAQVKQAQDQMTIAGLKQAVAGMKQQMALVKQMQAIEGQSAEVRKAAEDLEKMGEAQIAAAELEIRRFEAESKARIGEADSQSKRISAEASMVSAVDKASRPDPQPKPAGAPA